MLPFGRVLVRKEMLTFAQGATSSCAGFGRKIFKTVWFYLANFETPHNSKISTMFECPFEKVHISKISAKKKTDSN